MGRGARARFRSIREKIPLLLPLPGWACKDCPGDGASVGFRMSPADRNRGAGLASATCCD